MVAEDDLFERSRSSVSKYSSFTELTNMDFTGEADSKGLGKAIKKVGNAVGKVGNALPKVGQVLAHLGKNRRAHDRAAAK